MIGTFLVTGTRNVPLNERLQRIAATAPDAGLEWSDYAARWTRWNHVRTLAAALATVAFGAGLLQR